jgi:hypothetical protein
MKSRSLFLAVLLTLPTAGAMGQSSFGNITVTGTASINDLNVTGPVDMASGMVSFGSQANDPSMPGVIFDYSQFAIGQRPGFTQTMTLPGAAWAVQRLGSATSAMQLTGANQLILTSTQSFTQNSIVIDPTAGSISINGQQVL